MNACKICNSKLLCKLGAIPKSDRHCEYLFYLINLKVEDTNIYEFGTDFLYSFSALLWLEGVVG